MNNNFSFLTRPVVFFDLETTGTNPLSDRIIEIACIKISPDGSRDVKETIVNPMMTITKKITSLTGITQEQVNSAPTFQSISKSIFSFLEGCDLAGYNVNRFDIPLLITEFRRSDIFYEDYMIKEEIKMWDMFQILCRMHPRNLSTTYEFYTGKKMETAHRALADIEATIEVASAQLEKYKELSKDMSVLDSMSTYENAVDRFGKLIWVDDEPAISFGKYTGKTLRQIIKEDKSYIGWLLAKANLPKDTIKILENAMMGRNITKSGDYIG